MMEVFIYIRIGHNVKVIIKIGVQVILLGIENGVKIRIIMTNLDLDFNVTWCLYCI